MSFHFPPALRVRICLTIQVIDVHLKYEQCKAQDFVLLMVVSLCRNTVSSQLCKWKVYVSKESNPVKWCIKAFCVAGRSI